MEQELDYRKELEEARKVASKMELRGHEHLTDAYWEVVCGTVLLAEHDLREQDQEWEIASLAREMLIYAERLAGHEQMLDNVYEATRRMLEALYNHPRLKARLLAFEIKLLKQIEARESQKQELLQEAEDELSELQNNIRLADEGRLHEIPQTGHLKGDPIEWTARWEEVIDEADRKVFRKLADTPRGMGFCYAFWHMRAQVLSKDYHLEWKSPQVMNPRVMFD